MIKNPNKRTNTVTWNGAESIFRTFDEQGLVLKDLKFIPDDEFLLSEKNSERQGRQFLNSISL